MKSAIKKERKKVTVARQYRTFCVVFLIACLIFFTSTFWLPNTQEVMNSEFGTQEKSSTFVTLTLNNWEYNPDTRYMEATFSCDTSSSVSRPSYTAVAYSINAQERPIEAVIAYDDDNVLIVSIPNVPKDWEILSLWIQDNSEQQSQSVSEQENTSTRSGANFKCDARMVKNNLTLGPKTETDYRVLAVENEILSAQRSIDSANDKIRKNDEKIAALEAENRDLKADEPYQTEEEIASTESRIKSNQNQIDSLSEENGEQRKQISSYEEKISLLHQKIEAIRAGTA